MSPGSPSPSPPSPGAARSPAPPGCARRRWSSGNGALSRIPLLLLAVLVGCSGARHLGPRPPGPVTAPSPAAAPPSTAAPPRPPSTAAAIPLTSVAHALVPSLAVFSEPGAPEPASSLANPRPLGGPLVLLVTQTRPGWVEALLPVRPNGARGWIRAADVSLSAHDFRIVVKLGAHRITVSKGGGVIDDEPIATGTGDTPTPGGLYYTIDFVRVTDDGSPYGPYAYGLSGYSDVLTSFGGGPGQFAIHGTDDPASLGHDASHGCIRMSNAGITRLAGVLPLGVPVEITP